MLRILRKLRQSLVDGSKVRSYFFYAVGEIFLVVIGILIALEINNWNQNLIERRKEQLLLQEIHSEFLFNQAELEENGQSYRRVLEKCSKLIDLFPIDAKRVQLDTLARYLYGIDFNGSFDMSSGSIQSLKNSYSFEIISDEELRTLLIRIDDLVKDYSEREERSISFVELEFGPYLQRRLPFPFSEGIKDERVDLIFLETIEFENMIKERVEKIRIFLNMAEREDSPLVRAINRIIELSAS